MTWSILCNLFFLYNKKRHGRILFFHTYYLLLYSTRYTFFSIICVSCTYFPLRVNWIHSIHAYHLYLILHQAQAPVHLYTMLLQAKDAGSDLPTVQYRFYALTLLYNAQMLFLCCLNILLNLLFQVH